MAGGNQTEAVRILLEHGANPDAVGSYKKPAIAEAVDHSNAEMVSLLLDYGANPDAIWNRIHVVFEAASDGHPEIIRLLVEHGADVNAKDYEGKTVLLRPCVLSEPELVSLILSKGGEPDFLIAEDDMTPVKMAMHYNQPETVKALLKCGADVNLRTHNKRTYLHEAADDVDLKMARILIEAGADVNAKVKFGNTPVDEALSQGNDKMVKLLRSAGGRPGQRSSTQAGSRSIETAEIDG